MDRSLKKKDTVKVYAKTRMDKAVDTFRAVPYSVHGMDSYMYQGAMYKGYQCPNTDEIYIILTNKTFGPNGRPQ